MWCNCTKSKAFFGFVFKRKLIYIILVFYIFINRHFKVCKIILTIFLFQNPKKFGESRSNKKNSVTKRLTKYSETDLCRPIIFY